MRILLAEPYTAVTEAIFAGRPYNATYRIHIKHSSVHKTFHSNVYKRCDKKHILIK